MAKKTLLHPLQLPFWAFSLFSHLKRL